MRHCLLWKPRAFRLCRNSKLALLKPVFGGVLPLNFKNNSLQANLRGAVFSENNYDTASLHGVAKGNISTFVLPLFNGLWPYNKATRFTGGSLPERKLREGDQGKG